MMRRLDLKSVVVVIVIIVTAIVTYHSSEVKSDPACIVSVRDASGSG
jgi:hypothetical protein